MPGCRFFRSLCTVPTQVLQDLPGGPFVIAEPGSRGEDFEVNPGPSVRLDIPVDPLSLALWVHKSVNRDVAAIGDFLQYTVTVEKIFDIGRPAVSCSTVCRRDFDIRKGSARINGVEASNPSISADGRSMTFSLGALPEEGKI